MKYANLHSKTIQDLTDDLCILKHSLDDFSNNIQAAKAVLADTVLEHERITNRVILCKDALTTLIDEKEEEQKRYEEVHDALDKKRFNGFRDDRGESVPDLPLGPVAIVPLGATGSTPQSIKWDDEDSPHAREKKQDIDFKECHHKRFEGPFVKYSGTYTCNNCNTSVLACFDCQKDKNESNKRS